MEFIFRIVPVNEFDYKTIISICTGIIALLAFVLSIITTYFQRKHNRNSVKPILNINMCDYEKNISVSISNNGVGPATIEFFLCSFGGQEGHDILKFVSDLEIIWYTFSEEIDIVKRTIRPGDRIMLIKSKDHTEKQAIELKKRLSQMRLTIRYTDIYGREVFHTEQNLEWYNKRI